MQNNGYYLIVAGIVAIIVELLLGVATGFDLFIIGVLLIAGGSIALFSSFVVGVWAAIILCLLYVIFGRKILKQSLSIETKKTNIDSIIGKTAIVTKHITPSHPGQVKVDGEVWRAQSESELPVGNKVSIVSVSGVTLKVQ